MSMLTNPVWFSPINVLYHFGKLEDNLTNKQKQTKSFRKAQEMNDVAKMLVGMIKLQEKEYWIQLVDDKEGSPDIRTGCYFLRKDKPKTFHTQDVELVVFEEHSKEKDLASFLQRTKFSKKKSYDKKTTILVVVRKSFFLRPLKIINREFQKLNINSPIVILGRTHPIKQFYKIAQVYQVVDLVIEFELEQTCSNIKKQDLYHGVLVLKRGTDSELEFDYNPTEKHYPFEMLDF